VSVYILSIYTDIYTRYIYKYIYRYIYLVYMSVYILGIYTRNGCNAFCIFIYSRILNICKFLYFYEIDE
jgi:hypothetical protein